MTYDLILGDYAYSSWSLRGWLLFERFGLPRQTTMVNFKLGSVPDQMPGWTPAKTVPAVRTPDGAILTESLAIAEELASRHPDAGLWPVDPPARAHRTQPYGRNAFGFWRIAQRLPDEPAACLGYRCASLRCGSGRSATP